MRMGSRREMRRVTRMAEMEGPKLQVSQSCAVARSDMLAGTAGSVVCTMVCVSRFVGDVTEPRAHNFGKKPVSRFPHAGREMAGQQDLSI